MGLQISTGAVAHDSFWTGSWEAWAACRHVPAGLFYRDRVHAEGARAQRAREEQAKRICAGCLVRAECLEYALRVDERLGVWGGLTGAERRQLQ
jgi:WhiB family redox-sensing transcriptional regulator